METHYLYSRDGCRIAYQRSGLRDRQAPVLIFANGFATSHFYWKYLLRRFAPRAQLLTFDYKGHGLSEPPNSERGVRIEGMADDLIRVLDEVGAERATLVGFSLGCQVIFEAWREHHDRVEALVPILGTYGRPFDNLIHPRLGRVSYAFARAFRGRLARRGLKTLSMSRRWSPSLKIAQLTGMMGREVQWEDMQEFWAHLGRMDPEAFSQTAQAIQQHSSEDLLEKIDVPTLIIAGGRDVLTPKYLSEEMERRIARAEMFYLPEATHAGLFEYPQVIGERVEEFLARHELVPRP